MKKMDGTICDICRVVIQGNPPYERLTKKKNVLYFCSDECKDKDTTPGLLRADLGPDAGKNYKENLFED